MSISLPSTSIFTPALLLFLLLRSLSLSLILFSHGCAGKHAHAHSHKYGLTLTPCSSSSDVFEHPKQQMETTSPFVSECGGTFRVVVTAYICGSLPRINRSRGVLWLEPHSSGRDARGSGLWVRLSSSDTLALFSQTQYPSTIHNIHTHKNNSGTGRDSGEMFLRGHVCYSVH